MRHYQENSASAAGRIVALAMVVDGALAPAELRALTRTRLLEHIDIDIDTFHGLLEDLCHDLLTSSVEQGHVVIDAATMDSLLAEIADPDLRRRLLRAMWAIADADGVLADAEATLLARACAMWSVESRFVKEQALA
jgi:uncharacterized tellurite resistance protein B-like protein